jgi:hypothetical protein
MINGLKRKTGSASHRRSGRISKMQRRPATQNHPAHPAACDLAYPVFSMRKSYQVILHAIALLTAPLRFCEFSHQFINIQRKDAKSRRRKNFYKSLKF